MRQDGGSPHEAADVVDVPGKPDATAETKVFCETRKLAEEWTYRYLAAAALEARADADELPGVAEEPAPYAWDTEL